MHNKYINSLHGVRETNDAQICFSVVKTAMVSTIFENNSGFKLLSIITACYSFNQYIKYNSNRAKCLEAIRS